MTLLKNKKYLLLLTLLLLPLSIVGTNFSDAKDPEFTSIKSNELRSVDEDNNEDIQQFLRNLTTSDEEYEYFLNKEVEYDYSSYDKELEGQGNFLSRYTKEYENINEKNVTVDSFFVKMNQNINHPNVGLGILLYQSILHKLHHPEVDNEIMLSSFRLSILAGVNVVPSSQYFGTMKNMIDEPIDKDGYVRFSYLLMFAAKIGIKVNVINQYEGYSDYGEEIYPNVYFPSIMNITSTVEGKVVGDFLKYTQMEWISYGDKAASDMFHLKACLSRFYEDYEGKEHEYGIFLSSSNLDGINADGVGGHTHNQTGVIVTNHEYLYSAIRNFASLVSQYYRANDAPLFRIDYQKIVKEQKSFVKENGYDSIKDSMLFYSGTPKDNVFELFFTPLSGETFQWDDEFVYSRYVNKLIKSDGPISFLWHNPKSTVNFGFMDILLGKVNYAFMMDRGDDINLQNQLHIKMGDYTGNHFSLLKEGKNIGSIQVGRNTFPYGHEKDYFASYYENGIKHNALLLNSLNMHQGAFNYQVNQVLTIKENENTGLELTDNFYNLLLSIY